MTEVAKKSIWRAYLCWWFGGIFGLHHFYLRRDREAFICWSTFGGYVMGWLSDIFSIPRMVREANNDPAVVEHFKEQVRLRQRPPFSLGKFSGAIMVSYLWAQVLQLAIPTEEWDTFVRWSALLPWLVPVAVALGVWTAGNCGRQQGRIGACLLAAYAVYPVRFWALTADYWLIAVCMASALTFEFWSKQWLLTPAPRRGFGRRCATLYACGLVYLAMFGGYGYFKATIVDGSGDTVPLRDMVANIWASPWLSEINEGLNSAWKQINHNGFAQTWKQFYDQIDVNSEANAFKALGLLPTASQAEITATFRRLSKELHPDKVKSTGPEKRAAEERFMEISQAYEKLSKMKAKRRQKNRKSTDGAASDPITL